jgi:hypothetical protein
VLWKVQASTGQGPKDRIAFIADGQIKVAKGQDVLRVGVLVAVAEVGPAGGRLFEPFLGPGRPGRERRQAALRKTHSA